MFRGGKMNVDLNHWLNRILRACKVICLCLIASGMGVGTGFAAAGDYAPVKIVNDQAISGFELRQRIAFLELLRQPGDVRTEAINGLIDDRLRNARAKATGLSLSSEAVMAGMTEFASRANLTAEEFITAIGQANIAPETFRDFVSSGLLWREVVRNKYGAQIVISEAAIDRALQQFSIPEALTVTLAEISLPATGETRSAALAAARELRIDLDRGRDFAEAARSLSTAPTARAGGVLGPALLSALPDDVAKAVRILPEGGVSAPVVLDDRVVIYKMIASAQMPVTVTAATEIDYAEVILPNTDQGLRQAAELRSQADSCDDLYAAAPVSRQTVGLGAVPADISAALQMLDAGEVSTQVTRGSSRVFLMLCHRGAPIGTQASRDEVRLLLTNQRLGALASVYLEQLRADALIVDP